MCRNERDLGKRACLPPVMGSRPQGCHHENFFLKTGENLCCLAHGTAQPHILKLSVFSLDFVFDDNGTSKMEWKINTFPYNLKKWQRIHSPSHTGGVATIMSGKFTCLSVIPIWRLLCCVFVDPNHGILGP